MTEIENRYMKDFQDLQPSFHEDDDQGEYTDARVLHRDSQAAQPSQFRQSSANQPQKDQPQKDFMGDPYQEEKDLSLYRYIGRQQDEERVIRLLQTEPGPLALTGVYGIGKRTFLQHLANRLKEEEDWIVVSSPILLTDGKPADLRTSSGRSKAEDRSITSKRSQSSSDSLRPSTQSSTSIYQALCEEIYQAADPAIRKMIEVISGIRIENGMIYINAPGEKYRSIQYRMLANSMVRILKEAGSSLLIVMGSNTDESTIPGSRAGTSGIEPIPTGKSRAGISRTESITSGSRSKAARIATRGTTSIEPYSADTDSAELRDLIAFCRGLAKGGYPISILMTASLKNRLPIRSYPLEMLNPWDIKEAYNQILTDRLGLGEEDLLQLTRMTGGYPLAYQMLLEQIIESPGIKYNRLLSIESSYRTNMFRKVYYQLYQPLSRVEKQILDIMKEFPEEDVPITYICEKLERPKSYLSVYRNRLLKEQIVRTDIRGTLRFAFPMFRDFLREYQILFQGRS